MAMECAFCRPRRPPTHEPRPGLRTGTKVAVVDRMGGLVATDVVHVAAWATSLQRLAGLCRLHAVELVSLGDGTGSRCAP